jgi:hypothetical protein
MPHVSRHALTEKAKRHMTDCLTLFLSDHHVGRRKKVFREMLTKTERTMLAKRFVMLHLIREGCPTHTISSLLRVSPSTVARFEVKIEKGLYAETIQWLQMGRNTSRIEEVIRDILATPFEAQKKSFSRRLREWEEKYYG